MDIKLTDQQRNALAGTNEPLPIQDDQNLRTYYLLNEEAFLHLQGLQAEQEHRCHEQLQRLIDEGMQSPGVPADEAFARLRAVADELSRTNP